MRILTPDGEERVNSGYPNEKELIMAVATGGVCAGSYVSELIDEITSRKVQWAANGLAQRHCSIRRKSFLIYYIIEIMS